MQTGVHVLCGLCRIQDSKSFLRAERREGLVLWGPGQAEVRGGARAQDRGLLGAPETQNSTPGPVLRAFGSELAELGFAILSCET